MLSSDDLLLRQRLKFIPYRCRVSVAGGYAACSVRQAARLLQRNPLIRASWVHT